MAPPRATRAAQYALKASPSWPRRSCGYSRFNRSNPAVISRKVGAASASSTAALIGLLREGLGCCAVTGSVRASARGTGVSGSVIAASSTVPKAGLGAASTAVLPLSTVAIHSLSSSAARDGGFAVLLLSCLLTSFLSLSLKTAAAVPARWNLPAKRANLPPLELSIGICHRWNRKFVTVGNRLRQQKLVGV